MSHSGDSDVSEEGGSGVCGRGHGHGGRRRPADEPPVRRCN